ncbi:MAG TPA: hypothetical protein PK431_11630 [Chitinophagales bacterium]|nr:hypothetical protein [Chitinophagales bacterium]
MGIKQDIPAHIRIIVRQIDEQIDRYQDFIKRLEAQKQMYLTQMPDTPRMFPENIPLTRSLIRNFIEGYRHPVQTVETIELLYPKANEDEKNKLVKTLSVIFNQMAAEGEVIIEKRKGVKGNFYKSSKK